MGLYQPEPTPSTQLNYLFCLLNKTQHLLVLASCTVYNVHVEIVKCLKLIPGLFHHS